MPDYTVLDPTARNRDALRECERPSRFPETEWRCTSCNKLLGVFRDRQLHLRFARAHEYLVAVPAALRPRARVSRRRAGDLHLPWLRQR